MKHRKFEMPATLVVVDRVGDSWTFSGDDLAVEYFQDASVQMTDGGHFVAYFDNPLSVQNIAYWPEDAV